MIKTLGLTLCALVAMSSQVFAHTGVSEHQGGLFHDLRHLFMDHDGSMATGLTLAVIAGGVVSLCLALRRHIKS
ncbi:MAG TPA: hypothetical protein QGG18_06930 [Rhodospirillales bacterium]|nr:hypothetical protein [Rhodospirillales bacterium]